MRKIKLLLIIAPTLLILCSLHSPATAQEAVTPKGWKKVTACEFSFILPESMRPIETRPVDSCLARYKGKDISISLDYGWYSEPSARQDWMKDYQSSKVTISGRPARLITYFDGNDRFKNSSQEREAVTKIHIVTNAPKENEAGMTTALLMTILTKDSYDQETVKRVYNSTVFAGR